LREGRLRTADVVGADGGHQVVHRLSGW
jgi:hypothetical protein